MVILSQFYLKPQICTQWVPCVIVEFTPNSVTYCFWRVIRRCHKFHKNIQVQNNAIKAKFYQLLNVIYKSNSSIISFKFNKSIDKKQIK